LPFSLIFGIKTQINQVVKGKIEFPYWACGGVATGMHPLFRFPLGEKVPKQSYSLTNYIIIG